MNDSTITKMQLHYWEAKQTFLKKVKRKEDDFVVASDAELDAKLELLKSIDETNQNLLNLLEFYQDRICALAQEECILGRFLRECSKHDTTKAGNLMSSSGKTFIFSGHQFIILRNVLIRSFRDVQTFQYRAVADTFDTVEQMEKSRTTYRAALLWMKDFSQKQLDPDAYIQMDKFKKIQNYVREKKKHFEKLKLDTIQKIDLLSASRCNLFNNILLSYQNSIKSVFSKTNKTMDIFVDTFKSHLNYEFTMLKELNVDSNPDEAAQNFEEKLKEILSQQNSNEVDMLIFFETDYFDEKQEKPGENNKKEIISKRKRDNELKSVSKLKNTNSNENDKMNIKPKTKETEALLDMNFDMQQVNKGKDCLDRLISLIDLDYQKSENQQENTEFIDKLLITDNINHCSIKDSSNKANQPNVNNTKTKNNEKKNSSSLDTWMSLFADIDPLANLEEFDKQLSSDNKISDRNC